MKLEQAIKRTEAVIGLPDLSDAGIGFPNIRIQWGRSGAYQEDCNGQRLDEPDPAAFALLRDHAQQVILERGWTVQRDERGEHSVRNGADTPLAQGRDLLAVMLTALEAGGE